MEKMLINLQDVDIVETPLFDEYAYFKNETAFELENRQFIRTYLPTQIKARDEALSSSLKKMNPETLKAKADALIRSQKLADRHAELLEHMSSKQALDFARFNAMWSPVLWQAHESPDKAKVNLGAQTIDAFDLDFMIAETLQHLYAEEDPKAEYYDWIERQKKIEIDINTEGTTEDEIVARNTFISFLDDRETEIKRIMTLYAGAAFNPNSRQQQAAQEKLKFLAFKLSELRRLRERTQNTKSKADDKEYFEEKERREQRQAIAATAGLAAMALTAEILSPGEQRLREKNANTLEHGIGESFVRLRPETTSKEEARARIDSARRNRQQMMDMFTAMRNGISKEEWERLHQTNKVGNSENIRSQIHRISGFQAQKFREYTNSQSA